MASTSVNPDLEDQVPGGAGVVVRVLQGLEQPVERPGPVVGEDDDPEGGHQGDQIGEIRRVAKLTEQENESGNET